MAVELLHQLGGELFKGGAVLIGPPGIQVALAIKLRALIIKAMANLVADDGTDGAEVFCGIGLWVIERRAQDCCREGDVIDHRVIKGVDRLRGGHPLITVSWLANLGQFKVMGESGAGAGISQQVPTLSGDLEARVITPGIREANLGLELGELFQRALAGGRRHPLQLRDALAVGGDEVIHQLIHLTLGGGREVLFHKYLANLFAH